MNPTDGLTYSAFSSPLRLRFFVFLILLTYFSPAFARLPYFPSLSLLLLLSKMPALQNCQCHSLSSILSSLPQSSAPASLETVAARNKGEKTRECSVGGGVEMVRRSA